LITRITDAIILAPTTPTRFFWKESFVRLFALAVICFITTLSGSYAAQPTRVQHTVERRDLGTPFNSWTIPAAINNRGEIVGLAYADAAGNGPTIAFLWTPDRGYETLINGAEGSAAHDINERGDVVGSYTTCGMDQCQQFGFISTRKHGFRDLGSFIPNAINDRGDMAGLCVNNTTATACVKRRGAIKVLGPEGSYASAINATGDVVGQLNGEAVVWLRAREVVILGPGAASSINNRRLVGGWDGALATVWTENGPVPASFTIPFSLVRSINSRGWAVVVEEDADASIWDPRQNTTVRLDLAFSASDITDNGIVVGQVLDENGISNLATWRVRQRDLRPAEGQ
jgi:hypothetical protein